MSEHAKIGIEEMIRSTYSSLAKGSEMNDRGIIERLADYHLITYITEVMDERLSAARDKGRSGWWREDECSIEHLRNMLEEHVQKGDMRDVLNLAAMIYVREIIA